MVATAAEFDGVIAVVVTYHSPEYHPSYGHKTRYLWPQAVTGEFNRWKNRVYDSHGRLVKATQYSRVDAEESVAIITYVALQGDREASPPQEDDDEYY